MRQRLAGRSASRFLAGRRLRRSGLCRFQQLLGLLAAQYVLLSFPIEPGLITVPLRHRLSPPPLSLLSNPYPFTGPLQFLHTTRPGSPTKGRRCSQLANGSPSRSQSYSIAKAQVASAMCLRVELPFKYIPYLRLGVDEACSGERASGRPQSGTCYLRFPCPRRVKNCCTCWP
jgi:hypothetical protein